MLIITCWQVSDWSSKLGEVFWSESFWLPANCTWKDLEESSNINYPDSSHVILYPILLAFFLLVFKNLILIPFVLSPLATHIGFRIKHNRQPKRFPALEILYRTYGYNVPLEMLEAAGEELSWSRRRLELWLLRKKNSMKRTSYEKFIDTSYLSLYHVIFTSYGLYVFYDKSYTWNLDLCWENFPFQEVSIDVWWYYMMGLGYFWSVLFSLVVEDRGKEYAVFCAHHIFTILLMTFSWINNFMRIGSLVLLTHSISDCILWPAKMFRHAKYTKTTDTLFVVFFVVWLLTRIVVFPFYLLTNTLALGHLTHSFYIYVVLLLGLMALNIRWTVLIFTILYKKLCKGELVDVTSSDESNRESQTGESTDAGDARG